MTIESTPWQDAMQAELNRAGAISAAQNKTITVTIPEGSYEFVSLTIPGHVFLRASGEGRSVRLKYVGSGGHNLITLRNGYQSGLHGFELTCADPRAEFVTAIKADRLRNSTVSDIRFAHYGAWSTGIDLSGRESVRVINVDVRCESPVVYRWGDNCVFRDCDLGSAGRAVVTIAGMPQQLVFDGSQTWQGGEHAVYGVVDFDKSGQGLNFYNVRWEQSSTLKSPNHAAVHLDFTNRQLENLMFVGSRWTDRVRGFSVSGVHSVTEIGSRLPGSR